MWFHPRYLLYEGEKMSKSKGTFFTARDLFARGHGADALRLELIRTHYRRNASFSEQDLPAAATQLERWRRFVDAGEASSDTGTEPESVRTAFADAMHDDLNVAGAIGEINRWIAETPNPTQADAAMMRTFDEVLGVLSLASPEAVETEVGTFLAGVEPSDEVIEKIIQRANARKDKDFARSDEIRDELLAMGYAIKDAAGGKVEVSPGSVTNHPSAPYCDPKAPAPARMLRLLVQNTYECNRAGRGQL